MRLFTCCALLLAACAGEPLPAPNAANDPSNPRAAETPMSKMDGGSMPMETK